jgi:hypothetical protein
VASVNTQNLNGDEVRLNFWQYREVGDSTTNPMPSFVGHPIDAISFYKNRIVFASRQNVICSQAGDYFNFFASTVITIVDSDPIDLSASSLKPIRLKYMRSPLKQVCCCLVIMLNILLQQQQKPFPKDC